VTPAITSDRALAVVAGVLVDAHGRVLIAQRAATGSEAGKWEFAGGKIRPGETAPAALRRELREELGIGVDAASELAVVRWRGPPRSLNLHTFRVGAWRGDPHAREHQQLRWIAPSELIRYPMPAPDRPIRARLALPRQYLITPEPVGPTLAFVEEFARAIDNPAVGIVSLRAKSLLAAAHVDLAQRCLACARARRPDLIMLIHGEIELALRLGFDGAHLSSAQLLEAAQRPLAESAWVLASCHSPAELRVAEALGVDAATLSPIRATPLHAQSRPLGWRQLGTWSRSSFIPIYALGGTSPADLDRARAAGAHGIAAIRGLWGNSPGAK
jgi:8-oxo-dGTP diphosphatase